MRAIIARTFGGPDVLELAEMPRPTPAPDEVLLEVHYAGVNYADTLFRADTAGSLSFALPLILGFEATGIVRAVGHEVDDLAPGDPALISLIRYARLGCYAEYVTAPRKAVIPMPADADMADFLCLTHAVYARQMLEASVQPDDVVFVSAAAGGVGSYAMQLAKRFGASAVIGGVGSDEKLALLQSRGFDAVNYSHADWPERLRAMTGGTGPTLMLSSIAGDFLRQSQQALARGGRIIAYGFSGEGNDATINLPALGSGRQSILSNPARLDNQSRLIAYEDLHGLLRSGGLPYRDKTILPFADATQAHRMIADRANIGKIILDLRA